MSARERASFGNLLLLCKPDHDLVDYKPTLDEYPPDLLRAWKKDREGAYGAELAGLEGVTDESLQEMVGDAIISAKEEILTAIGELSHANDQAASLPRRSTVIPYSPPGLVITSRSLRSRTSMASPADQWSRSRWTRALATSSRKATKG
jgi:hypothetical protein